MSSGSDDDEYVNKSFDQNRKAAAQVCDPQIREILKEWYDEPDEHVHNVESEKDGKYDPGEMDTTKLVEYAAIDWLVQTEGTTIGVGQRIRKGSDGWRDMTLRGSNGTGNPSERQTIPAGQVQSGLYPRDYVLAVRDGFDVHRAVLLDTRKLMQAVETGRVTETGPYENDDASSYYVYPLAELHQADVIKREWVQ